MRVAVPTFPELWVDTDSLSENDLAEAIRFEQKEVHRYESLMGSATHSWRRWWPARRHESVALLGLMAPDEGRVNADAEL